MKRPHVKCNACKGTGLAPLSRHLFATLALFARGQRLTAKMAHARKGEAENVTAANNRLEELRDLGFLERAREGRSYYYYAPFSNIQTLKKNKK